MEFIIPLFILLILGAISAAITMRLTKNWKRSVGIAVLFAFFLPILYAAYVLGMSNLRDDYHRRRSEAYISDGSCTAPLGHGYELQYFDEDPWMAMIVVVRPGGPLDLPYERAGLKLVENRVQRLAVTASDAYGQAGKTDEEDGAIDHFFWINFASGTDERFKSEAELRSKVEGVGPLRLTEEAFSDQEKRERRSTTTWAIFTFPFGLGIVCWFMARRMRGRLG